MKNKILNLYKQRKYRDVVLLIESNKSFFEDSGLMELHFIASELTSMPYLKEFIEVSELIKYPLLEKVIKILDVPFRPYDDSIVRKTLVYFNTEKTVNKSLSTNDKIIWTHEKVHPFDKRKPLNVKNKLLKPLEKEYRKTVDQLIKFNNLKRKSERHNIHLAVSKIHFMMVSLNYFILRKTSEFYNHSLSPQIVTKLENDYPIFVKQMKLYQLISDLVNWRISIDARDYDGYGDFPICYKVNDVKMACQRQDNPSEYLNSIS